MVWKTTSAVAEHMLRIVEAVLTASKEMKGGK